MPTTLVAHDGYRKCHNVEQIGCSADFRDMGGRFAVRLPAELRGYYLREHFRRQQTLG
jgi:hypothetical protein